MLSCQLTKTAATTPYLRYFIGGAECFMVLERINAIPAANPTLSGRILGVLSRKSRRIATGKMARRRILPRHRERCISELSVTPAFQPAGCEVSRPRGPRGRNASELADRNVGVTPPPTSGCTHLESLRIIFLAKSDRNDHDYANNEILDMPPSFYYK